MATRRNRLTRLEKRIHPKRRGHSEVFTNVGYWSLCLRYHHTLDQLETYMFLPKSKRDSLLGEALDILRTAVSKGEIDAAGIAWDWPHIARRFFGWDGPVESGIEHRARTEVKAEGDPDYFPDWHTEAERQLFRKQLRELPLTLNQRIALLNIRPAAERKQMVADGIEILKAGIARGEFTADAVAVEFPEIAKQHFGWQPV